MFNEIRLQSYNIYQLLIYFKFLIILVKIVEVSEQLKKILMETENCLNNKLELQ